MIQVAHLSKRFAAGTALEDVSFNVARGEIVGVLGPNGAGKTTLLRILTGFWAPSAGSVLVDGLNVMLESLAVRRRIGYLPENVPLYPELRVDEYLTFRARLKRVPRKKIRERVAEVKMRCGLEDVGRRIIGQLSRGYCQRVGLADCLVHDPECLLLDEPTISLDPNQARAVRDLISRLGQRHTVMLSTHFLAEAEGLCRRVLILNRGRIMADDSPVHLASQLSGGVDILVEVQGPPAAVSRQLQELPGVRQVAPPAPGEPVAPGWNRLIITCAPGADIRAAVADLARRQQWPLRELRLMARPLEEVFESLTAAPRERPGI